MLLPLGSPFPSFMSRRPHRDTDTRPWPPGAAPFRLPHGLLLVGTSQARGGDRGGDKQSKVMTGAVRKALQSRAGRGWAGALGWHSGKASLQEGWQSGGTGPSRPRRAGQAHTLQVDRLEHEHNRRGWEEGPGKTPRGRLSGALAGLGGFEHLHADWSCWGMWIACQGVNTSGRLRVQSVGVQLRSWQHPPYYKKLSK